MLWLWITISFYFILAIVFLGDKYLLTGAVPKPEVYTFYIGLSWILVLFLIPFHFAHFYVPRLNQIIISLLAGASYIYGIFWFNKSLCKFEASRVVPAIGAFSPIFTFLIIYLFSSEKQTFSSSGIVAFLLLIFGSVLITSEKQKSINLESLKNSLLAAILFSISFILTKYVYLGQQSFWNGFIWIKFGGVLAAFLFLIFYKGVKGEVFKKREAFPKKTFSLFIFNQSLGAVSNMLQNYAFAIAPLSYIAIIQALQGTQYAFLLIFTVLISLKFPGFIKEEISRKILTQKVIAILFIAVGIAIFALNS